MQSVLLATKLFVPQPRREAVPRPRLIERLNAGLHRKLTLISAPAGFGKTTLLSEWVAECQQPVAWLSLDKGDNDPTRFLAYLVAALQTVTAHIGADVLSMLQSPQPLPIESILIALINEITTIPDNFVLILDDYQVIEDQTINEALTYLLEHLPPVMHLAIVTRSDPFLPLSRLRAWSQMTELRSDDLRFSIAEATYFLNRVMGLALSEDDIASLETRTEGWVAGLQLAGLSMQDRSDTAGFISAFAGDDRYIIDYLVDEVLAQRPQGTKDFLMQTSILDRMSGPLCDAVTGQEDGQRFLEVLEQANLFINPLDNQRRWYRYHYLFAEVLRNRLGDSMPPHAISNLHQRASQWYEENDFLVEAVEHAFAAKDFENVIHLVERGSMELLMRSQQSLLLKWQEQIPRQLAASHPEFCMTIAWAWDSVGHPEKAEECLQLVEQSLGAQMVEMFSGKGRADKITPTIQVILAEIAVLRIELASKEGNISRVFELSRLVLPYLEDEENLPRDDHIVNLHSVVLFVLGLAYKISGKLEEAGDALSRAAELGREQGNVHIVAGSIGRLASVQSMQGQLSQAVSACQRGLKLVQEMVGERSPVSGLIHAELGNLLYEQNDLELALRHLQGGIDLAKRWAYLEAVVPGYLGLARVRAARGDWQGAFAALDELSALGESDRAMVVSAVESLRARLWVAQGEVDAASRWVSSTHLDPQGEISFHRLGDLTILARVLISQGAPDEAVDLLTHMMDTADSAGWHGQAIQTRILLALAHHRRGDKDESMVMLEQALFSARPAGYVRIFVDESEPMKVLLREAESRDIAPDYVSRLLAVFETDNAEVKASSAPSLVEPLSKRELDVLHLLKTELSGPEIADELMIALSTMRTHTQNIYSKLGVRNRREAVRKADDLHIG